MQLFFDAVCRDVLACVASIAGVSSTASPAPDQAAAPPVLPLDAQVVYHLPLGH